MKFFLDTANIEEIKEAVQLGLVEGVTTNPLLASKEGGKDFATMIKEIADIVPGPVSAELVSTTFAEMVPEARRLAKIAPNIVVKVPISVEGLKTIHALSQEGIKTNATLIFSANQGLVAAKAGATYISPFIGRLEDVNVDAVQMLTTLCDIVNIHGLKTEIIAASVRTTTHATQAALAGAHIATVPYKVLLAMVEHPMTDIVNRIFMDAWNKSDLK